MAFQLIHWCITRRGDTPEERERKNNEAELELLSEFLNDEANQIVQRMRLKPDEKVGLLHHYKIGDEAMKDVFLHFDANTNLLQLNLAHNIISDEGITYCSDSLKTNSTLLELNLNYNNIGDDGVTKIGDALKLNTSLISLQLSNNDFTEVGSSNLLESLSVNDSLTSLCLNSNIVGDKSLLTLSSILRSNHGLSRLELYQAGITSEGAMALADGLRDNNTLEVLNVGSNEIDDSGGTALSSILMKNGSLKSLEIFRNKLTDSTVLKLINHLDGNMTLTHLNIGGNTVSKETLQLFYSKIAEYRKRTSRQSKLSYINTYECVAWGELNQGAKQKFNRWLSAMKDKGKIPVKVPCPTCGELTKKHQKPPWASWQCNNCDARFTQTEMCYGCENLIKCDVAFCKTCHDKESTRLREEQAALVTVHCGACATPFESVTSDSLSNQTWQCCCCLAVANPKIPKLCKQCQVLTCFKCLAIRPQSNSCLACDTALEPVPTEALSGQQWQCSDCKTISTGCTGGSQFCPDSIKSESTTEQAQLTDGDPSEQPSSNVSKPQEELVSVSAGDEQHNADASPKPTEQLDVNATEQSVKTVSEPNPAETNLETPLEKGVENVPREAKSEPADNESDEPSKISDKQSDTNDNTDNDNTKQPAATKTGGDSNEKTKCDNIEQNENPTEDKDNLPKYCKKCQALTCYKCYLRLEEHQREAKKARVDVPCKVCKDSVNKLPETPFKSWTCDGECKKTTFLKNDTCYGCITVVECDYCFCPPCYDKARQKIQKDMKKGPRICCPKCSQSLEKQPENTFPAWGCDSCGKTYASSDTLYGCATVATCDFCICQKCFIVKELAERAKQPVMCFKCKLTVSKAPENPFPAWGCDSCEASYTSADPIYGCETMSRCDFCFCQKCYSKMQKTPGCTKCKLPMLQISNNPFPNWGCDACGKPYTKSDKLFGCQTLKECDYCFCEQCFTEAGRGIAASSIPISCNKCDVPMQKLPENPFPSWGCDCCSTVYAQKDSVYGCPTVGKCDFCFCDNCYKKAQLNILQQKQEQPQIPCSKCKGPMGKYAKAPFPAWGCDGCGENHPGTDPVYGCSTIAKCDFCFCEKCHEKAVETSQKEEGKNTETAKQESNEENPKEEAAAHVNPLENIEQAEETKEVQRSPSLEFSDRGDTEGE